MKKPLSILMLCGLAACTAVGPDYKLADDAQFNNPSAQGAFAAAESGIAAKTDVPGDWWHLYNDPLLDDLERQALAANTDLRLAAANLARAQAWQKETDGARDIKAGIEFGAERTQLSGQSYLLSEQMPSQYLGSGGIHVAYQLDLFGRLKRAVEAASADREAAAAGLDLARITVAAEVARAYGEACSAGHQRQAAQRLVELQDHAVAVMTRLVAAGRIAVPEQTRSQAQLEQARAAVPHYLAQQKQALFRLAVLTGHPPSDYPRAVERCTQPPRLDAAIPVGDGAALLKRRPDIRQAERAVAAATARIGVATAALYPDVTLGLSAGSTGLLNSLTLPSAEYWGVGPLISWTLPDAASHARIEKADAETAAALARFDAVVLNALRETESGLTVYARDLDRHADLRAARDRYAEAAQQAASLFQAGRSPVLAGISAQQTLAAAEQALAASEDKLSADQISLFLALGGGWDSARITPR